MNPALEAVKRVRCPEAELRILEVPTVFGDSARLVTAEMDAFRPDVVLCVGQAAGRSAVTPERVAINVDDARIPDNAGQQPVDAPIVPGGPAAYSATVPVKDMVRACLAGWHSDFLLRLGYAVAGGACVPSTV